MADSQGQNIQIKASDEQLKGSYANMAQLAHTAEEFVVDFMNVLPPAGQLVSRIIVSPQHFKRFVQAAEENLKRYEEQFGAVKASEQPEHRFGFRTE